MDGIGKAQIEPKIRLNCGIMLGTIAGFCRMDEIKFGFATASIWVRKAGVEKSEAARPSSRKAKSQIFRKPYINA